MDRERLRRQLRNAERRLAVAERQQINVAAQSSYGGGWDQGPEDRRATRALNDRIASAHGVDELRAEVARLREAVGGAHDADQPTLLQRLRRLLGG